VNLTALRRRRVVVPVQIAVVAIVLAFFGNTLRGAWGEALPRLRDADSSTLAAALAVLGAYYLLFVLGWQWILASLGVRIPYGTALQAEMASMLAKYVPGGIWTSLARITWLRRSGAKAGTSLVLSSILLEGGLSAAAGVLVFVASLALVEAVDAPVLPLVAFGVALGFPLHPRVFVGVLHRTSARRCAPAPPRPSLVAVRALLPLGSRACAERPR
jgi:uncharacterized membrane protein YbhN (UPF0104 family)